MARKLSILVAILALVAAACGGGDETADTSAAPTTTTTTTSAAATSTTTTDAAPATTTTAAPTTTTAAPMEASTFAALLADDALEVRSARFEGQFEFEAGPDAEIAAGLFNMSFSGAFNTDTESSEMMIDFGDLLGAVGDELPPGFEGFLEDALEVRQIGDTSYIKWGLFSFFTGPDVEWVQFTDQEPGEFVSGFSFGVDPTTSPLEQIAGIGDAGVDIDEIGTEVIRGVPTTHYRVIVDAETLAEDLSPAEAQELRDSFGAEGLDELEFDVFIGDDGLLYRYSFNIETDPTADNGGIEALTATFDIYDYNTDIVIEAPENFTSGDELGGLFGSFLGGGF